MKYICKDCNALFNIVVIVQPNPMIGAVEDCPICQGDLQRREIGMFGNAYKDDMEEVK